jgi:hypothetical protein
MSAGVPVNGLIRIENPSMCAGAAVRDGVVIEAAPILGKLLGKPARQVLDVCLANGWKVEWLGDVASGWVVLS